MSHSVHEPLQDGLLAYYQSIASQKPITSLGCVWDEASQGWRKLDAFEQFAERDRYLKACPY